MAITLYDITVPVFVRGLGTLGELLEKGRAFAEPEQIDPEELLQARLAPDMLTLAGQVQRASDTAKFAAVRIGEVANQRFADEEKSFEDLQDRISRTQAFLGAVPRAAIDGRAGATITAQIGPKPQTIGATDYALKFALPNFFFHLTTAYAILRSEACRSASPTSSAGWGGGRAMRIEPVFLFDLDGTLVDSVYQHVLAWKEALDAEGIDLSVWRIHRRIGMSGGLFTNQLLRETKLVYSEELVNRLRRGHAEAYKRYRDAIRPLPGARELLTWLSDAGIPWAIATSGRMETAAVNLAALGVDPASTPVVTRDQVRYAKPDPDLFLAAAERLGAPIETAVVVGDAIWDMLAAVRCRALGVGLLSGGYGSEELRQAGAIRVFDDPADLLDHIDEVGGRR